MGKVTSDLGEVAEITDGRMVSQRQWCTMVDHS